MANKPHPIKDPDGNVFDGNLARGVLRIATGVMVTNAQGRYLHVIKEADPTKADLIRDALADFILTPVESRPTVISWP